MPWPGCRVLDVESLLAQAAGELEVVGVAGGREVLLAHLVGLGLGGRCVLVGTAGGRDTRPAASSAARTARRRA